MPIGRGPLNSLKSLTAISHQGQSSSKCQCSLTPGHLYAAHKMLYRGLGHASGINLGFYLVEVYGRIPLASPFSCATLFQARHMAVILQRVSHGSRKNLCGRAQLPEPIKTVSV